MCRVLDCCSAAGPIPARVRPGAERAVVEGRLQVEPGGPVARQVNDSGGDLDDGGSTLILMRSVSAEGRSRATAGGRSVPVSLLTYLADDLVAVHGQADQQQLLRPGRQRQALDRFAGPDFAELLAAYQRVYHRHAQVRAELDELTTMARERVREADDLRRGVTEIQRLEPLEGEDIELVAEEERLANADALHAAATTAHEALAGDPASGSYDTVDVTACWRRPGRRWTRRPSTTARLGALAGRVGEAAYLLADVAAELASYVQSVEADPVRLAVVQERRAELTRLIRAYGAGTADGPPGGDLAAVLAWAKSASARLAELDNDEDRIGSLGAAGGRARGGRRRPGWAAHRGAQRDRGPVRAKR